MKALSTDLRRRIWIFHDSLRATVDETAAHFSVGTATVKRILANLRKTGSLEPKAPTGGPQKSIPDDKLDIIRAIVSFNTDMTLAERIHSVNRRRDLGAMPWQDPGHDLVLAPATGALPADVGSLVAAASRAIDAVRAR
jgi:transposase